MYNGRVRTSHLSGRPPVLQPLRYKSGIPDSACNKLYDRLSFRIKSREPHIKALLVLIKSFRKLIKARHFIGQTFCNFDQTLPAFGQTGPDAVPSNPAENVILSLFDSFDY